MMVEKENDIMRAEVQIHRYGYVISMPPLLLWYRLKRDGKLVARTINNYLNFTEGKSRLMGEMGSSDNEPCPFVQGVLVTSPA